jgi:hypothetical protein
MVAIQINQQEKHMGTRGAIGFRFQDEDKISYNHFDSYPSVAGEQVVSELSKMLRAFGAGGVRKKVRSLVVLGKDAPDPTPEQQARLSSYKNANVSTERDTWYQLLRGTQGSPARILDAGYIEDSSGFLSDSLYCEFAYIINLDTEQLEFYRGFQKEVGQGRYAALESKPGSDMGYKGVSLVHAFSFAEIVNRDVESIVEEMETLVNGEPEDDDGE